MRRDVAVVILLVTVPSGCGGGLTVSGGPDGAVRRLRGSSISAAIRPLVAEVPGAVARLDELAIRERRVRPYRYASLGFVAACLALQAADRWRFQTLTFIGLSSCVVSLIPSIASHVIHPSLDDYGKTLEIYNEARPTTRWHAPQLGVP